MNNDNNNQHTRDNGQTVVLTLRKRYNTLRGRNRTGQESVPPTPHTDNGDAQEIPTDAAAVANPWGDIRPTNRRVQHSAPLHHRLSFDHGSGVIVLPEDGDWLDLHDDDEVDSDEDHHTHEHETNNDGNLDQSIASLASAESTAPTPGPGISSPSRTSRYGTYFHHPERRKQSIPGAFPGR